MGTFSESFEYDVKRTIMKMYEKMIDYKFELMRLEKNEKKRDQIEMEIFEIVHTMEEMIE